MVSNSLDSNQARRFVGPDLGPNCLQRLSADDTSRQRGKQLVCNATSASRSITRVLISLSTITTCLGLLIQ